MSTDSNRRPEILGERFEQALQFAAKLHRSQYRKTTPIPYISHLLRVAGLVLEFGADEDTAIAALLHDAVEDQGGMETARIIRSRFGDRVADLVLDCSDSVRSRGEAKEDWQIRKETRLARLKRSHDASSILISACDTLDNISCTFRNWQTCGDDVFRYFKTGKEGQQWYYSELIRIYEQQNVGPAKEIRELYNRLFG